MDTVNLVCHPTEVWLLNRESPPTTSLEVPYLTWGAAHTLRYLLDRVADNNRRYLVDSHIQAAPEVEALLEEPT